MEDEDSATTPRSRDTPESQNEMSETISSPTNALDMESKDETHWSCHDATHLTGNINEGNREALQEEEEEEEMSGSSPIPPDDAEETKDGSDMESENCEDVGCQEDDKQNGADVELPLTSQLESPNPRRETDNTDMMGDDCSVRAGNALHIPYTTEDEESSAASTSPPNSPSSSTGRDGRDMESEDCGGIAASTHVVTQGEKSLLPSSSQPNSPTSYTEKGVTVMEGEDCGVTSIGGPDVTRGEKTLIPTSILPESPGSCTERSNMVMENKNCEDADKDSLDMTQGESTLLPSTNQLNSPNSDAEGGSEVMESEDCNAASENGLDLTHGEKAPLSLASQLNSESSLNMISEGFEATKTTEHPPTSSPTQATSPVSNLSSNHDNVNMEDEDYIIRETNKKGNVSAPIEIPLPLTSQSDINVDTSAIERRDCFITQANQNIPLSSPTEASNPIPNQEKGEEEIMIPGDGPSQPLPLTPLPTTLLESESHHQEGDDNKETRNERKVKRGIKRKKPSASKGIQTSIHLLDSNSVFHDRVVNLPMLKREAGVVCVEDLQDLDVAFEEWPILLVSQLKLRDTIIESLNSVIRELVGHGQVLEQDLDYLKLKMLELQQEAKKRAKEDQQKSHTTQALEAESQTTEEDLTEAWSRWYYGCWGDYYSECDPTSSSYWPGHYTQQSTVPSRAKGTMDEETQQRAAEEESGGNTETLQAVNCKEEENEKEQKNKDSIRCEGKSDDTRRSEKRKKLKGKRKKERHKREKSSEKRRSTEGEQEQETEKSSTRRRKRAERENRGEESNNNTEITATAPCNTLPQESVTSIRSTKEMNGREEAEEEEGNEKNHGWDTSESITQQVAAAAAQAVVESGYVFQEELGLYYDYNTGYYYNAENGLYYDTQSGTYFYYDHSTQSYQFHSQVSPSDTTNTKKHRKKKANKGKSKSSNRDGDSREREEGECTESDHEEENVEESESEEEREEEDMASPDHHDEEGAPGPDVPPSLRLMVVEGGERVRVGELHVVTLNGGTIGRDPTNAVHLPDLNISKVHAEIEYRSAGPEDHHYFIRDLGSNNGTFVNNVRLSEARQTSSEVEVGHGWEVLFGSVKVKCHLHPGTLTCNECEPGLVLQNLPSQPDGVASFKNARCKERARRKALKAMQKKYKLTHREAQAASSVVAPGYTDRTLLRQTQKGSDNPYEKTEVASSEVPLRETNRGFTLLQKMGWSKGQGLGKDNTGRKEPIQQTSMVGKAGLGCSLPTTLPPPNPWSERRKKQLQITQERYSQQ